MDTLRACSTINIMSNFKKQLSKKQQPKKEPQPFSGIKPIDFLFEKDIICFAPEAENIEQKGYPFSDPVFLIALCEDSELFWPANKEYSMFCLDGNKKIIAHAIISGTNKVNISTVIRAASFTEAKHVVLFTRNDNMPSSNFIPGIFESKLINTLGEALKWINCKIEDLIIIGGGDYMRRHFRPYFSFRQRGLMPDELLPIT